MLPPATWHNAQLRAPNSDVCCRNFWHDSFCIFACCSLFCPLYFSQQSLTVIKLLNGKVVPLFVVCRTLRCENRATLTLDLWLPLAYDWLLAQCLLLWRTWWSEFLANKMTSFIPFMFEVRIIFLVFICWLVRLLLLINFFQPVWNNCILLITHSVQNLYVKNVSTTQPYS